MPVFYDLGTGDLEIFEQMKDFRYRGLRDFLQMKDFRYRGLREFWANEGFGTGD